MIKARAYYTNGWWMTIVDPVTKKVYVRTIHLSDLEKRGWRVTGNGIIADGDREYLPVEKS